MIDITVKGEWFSSLKREELSKKVGGFIYADGLALKLWRDGILSKKVKTRLTRSDLIKGYGHKDILALEDLGFITKSGNFIEIDLTFIHFKRFLSADSRRRLSESAKRSREVCLEKYKTLNMRVVSKLKEKPKVSNTIIFPIPNEASK